MSTQLAPTSTSHTAGPWRIGDLGKTVFGPPNGNPSPETVAHLTHKKNAILVSSAPEMLIALKGILAALTQPHTYPADVDAARIFARAAIARAEGRA